MNQAIKKKWVAALLSGEYQQTKAGTLRNSEGFCCLGVLCDILNPTGWTPNGGDDFANGDSGGYLCDEVLDEIDLSDKDQRDLASMNDLDAKDTDFVAIAKYIEENL